MRLTTKPSSLLIFLLVPEAATQKHLEILSEIAELLSDADFARKMAADRQTARLCTICSPTGSPLSRVTPAHPRASSQP